MALRRANDDLEQRVKERTDALHKLAYYDPVTDLPNRLKLLDDLQLLIDSAQSSDSDTAVVLLDIDRFSFLNGTMGYDAGTELLVAIGKRLALDCKDLPHTRKSIVGRFGADELACLVPTAGDGDILAEVVERIRKTIEEPFLVGGRELFLKCSIGVA